ncbi:SGNH/GDSL hydrolase family protein [Xylophilus sp.]|uniref:SGNH/GDSL hydrolase family protein n=1 Tax=Xylophilus sp. TaxID=2653893 RepID=UPI0013BA8540|nr:SGNH/GDSL hydrolase family protein [Xylophilus sp.]KAF1050113.1 MAG: hypothetical protein GAK38_00138 [Xylophilus sp.]
MIALLAAACLAAACGGGGGSPSLPPVSSVKVIGDSLADSGTFGYKFTVQGTAATGSGSTAIWPERVAAGYGLLLCPYYRFAGTAFDTEAACTSHAVGGGRINNPSAPAAPTAILQQIDAARARGFGSGDLVLIDGGGNDAADLLGAYLRVSGDAGASYGSLLGSLLDPAAVDAGLAGGPQAAGALGTAYMKALAARFAAAIQTGVAGAGAQRVVVLNMPAITRTPRVRQLLAAVAASAGGAASARVQALADAWVDAFNAELAARFAGSARVRIADFHAALDAQAASPAAYGLTNATDAACPATGTGGDGLPVYSLPACTAAALSARTPPAGAGGGADWWKSFAFSDSFHPTPYGHQLLGELVERTLQQAGWK